MLAFLAVMIGTEVLHRSIPYLPEDNLNFMMWALHAALFVGAVLHPLTFLGGAIITSVIWYLIFNA